MSGEATIDNAGAVTLDHTIASHNDTTATGTELETLTDGSNADTLHTHAAGTGTMTTVESAGAPVGDPDIVTLNFSGDFTITEPVDTEIGIAIDQTTIDHTQLVNIGTNSHATIDTHLADMTNPHGVTIRLDQLLDPTAAKTFTMGSNLLRFEAASATGRTTFASSTSTADCINIEDISGGSPGSKNISLRADGKLSCKRIAHLGS